MRNVGAALVLASALLSAAALVVWACTGWIITAMIVLLAVPVLIGGTALLIGTRRADRRNQLDVQRTNPETVASDVDGG
jgi:hypothetical protein